MLLCKKTKAPVLGRLDEEGNIEKSRGDILSYPNRAETLLGPLYRYNRRSAAGMDRTALAKRGASEALRRIDAERVREITWMFRKKSLSADDHVVIETISIQYLG